MTKGLSLIDAYLFLRSLVAIFSIMLTFYLLLPSIDR